MKGMRRRRVAERGRGARFGGGRGEEEEVEEEEEEEG
jgi:hypothetical protein